MEIPTDLSTETDRVLFIKAVAEFMVTLSSNFVVWSAFVPSGVIFLLYLPGKQSSRWAEYQERVQGRWLRSEGDAEGHLAAVQRDEDHWDGSGGPD